MILKDFGSGTSVLKIYKKVQYMKIAQRIGGTFFVFLTFAGTVQPMTRRAAPLLATAMRRSSLSVVKTIQQQRAYSRPSKIEQMFEILKREYDCHKDEVCFEVDFHSQEFVKSIVDEWELQHRIVKRLSCSFETARRLIGHPDEKASLLDCLAKSCSCTVRVIELVLDQEKKEWARNKTYRHINALNDEGQTLVFSAVQNNWSAALQFLLEMGADASIPNSQGITPLHVAVAHGNIEYIKALLAAGANPHVFYYEIDGLLPITPLRLAVEINNFKCVAELLECGASPEYPIEAYKTFLIEIARKQNNQDIIDLLEVYPLYGV